MIGLKINGGCRGRTDKQGTAFKAPPFALLASLLVVCLTTACQAPITYADGRSKTDLPMRRNSVVLEEVTESTMMGDKSIPNTSVDQVRYNEIVREQIASKLQGSGFSVVRSKEDCGICMSLKGRVYFLPFNPLTGGHVNIFVKTYDPKGAELFTAFYGRDFGLLSLAVNGGSEEIVRSSAERAAESLVGELKELKGQGTP